MGVHVALLLHNAGLVIKIQPFHNQLHHNIWMTKEMSAKALVIASAGMRQPRQLTYHLRHPRPGINLMQTVQDITDFVDHTGPISLFRISKKSMLCLRGKRWLLEFGGDFDEFEPTLPTSRSAPMLGIPAVDLANHASHSAGVVVVEFNGVSLPFLFWDFSH
jgi:hypothetical protein